MKEKIKSIIFSASVIAVMVNQAFADYKDCCNVSSKQRVIISTDIGGTDPDDNQSMAHLLMYTDRIDLEGLISSPSYGKGSKEEIFRMIDLFEKDMPKLNAHINGLMTPDDLRSITKQGRQGMAPFCGYSTATEGSQWIVECARQKSERPLWIAVWGGLDDVAQALHDAPDIADKIRVYWIGGPNKKWGINSYTYIVENFPQLYMIESNSSYRGFIADNKKNDEFNTGFYDTYLQDAGNIGADFINYYKGIPKMGDTPSFLYLLYGNPDCPEGESWGGSFTRICRSPRAVFHRPTTAQDTVPIFSIIELHLRGPVKNDIAPDSVCFQMELRNQVWNGYYLGDGDYAIKHSTYYTGTLPYKITSHLPDFPQYEAEITVENKWPGRKFDSDYKVGDNWYSDKEDPNLFMKNHQGAQTVLKWRNDVMKDWGKRLRYLMDKRTAKKILKQDKQEFFHTEEAKRIGDQLLLWQRNTGGWPKNIDMVSPMSEELKMEVLADKNRQDDSTTDNDATILEMAYLARLYKATGEERYKDAFHMGVEYLLSGQYENGGWPQFWPVMRDYQPHITYNDDAMVNTMILLRDAVAGAHPYDCDLCDEGMKNRMKAAFDKGVECMLATQIVVDGEPTVWCQQHDSETLMPAKARSYELPSYCSQESAAIVKLLMEIPNPDDRIVKAVNGAMKWFEENRIKNVTYKRENNNGKWEASLVENPKDDTPVWARFYDLENCQPFVCDRDGIPRRHLEEIGEERRNGYTWYNNRPSYLFPIYEEWKLFIRSSDSSCLSSSFSFFNSTIWR